MDFKETILGILETLKGREEFNNEVWKVRAYTTAIKNLKKKESIKTIEDIDGVAGVGKKIKARIVEILETGELAQARNINTTGFTALTELTGVHGIGTVKAKDLIEKHGITSVEQLTERQDLLNDQQKIGLKHYDDLKKRIPYSEMEKHLVYLKTVIDVPFEIVGSFRRKNKTSGDIDVLICSSDKSVLSRVIEACTKDKYIVDSLALGPKKFMGVVKAKRCKTCRRIDILLCPPLEYPFALLYFTGSAEFNQKMRAWVATNRNMSLSEHGFKDQSSGVALKMASIQSEEDIFKHLKLRYIPPEKRTPGATLSPVE
jgi:DNA polymerase/3'-5' exonuclease PolX